MRIIWRLTKWGLLALLLLVIILVAPIGYVETACRTPTPRTQYTSLITSAEFQRQEANTYLTYPEWHIVYAYEGLAKVLETGDEHQFGYINSVTGFWSSFCNLNRLAQGHGGADFNTRATIYVIGSSFMLEMGLKALYEETVGRLFAALRGPAKSPQDKVSADMAKDYASFLQQTPWYKYPFDAATTKLWAAPLDMPVRGWERRLALGGEWRAKTAYAKVIANAVAATGIAKLEIRTVVTNIAPANLSTIPGVQIIETIPEGIVINTPRYRALTNILKEISMRGGSIVEIAGNDDVLVTAIQSGFEPLPVTSGADQITSIKRDGFGDQRLLLNVRIAELANLMRTLASGNVTIEHVYDY
jgi:hypothetical protein